MTPAAEAARMALNSVTVEISANAVAWYGAIVATVGFLVSLYNVLRDRAKIKITYSKDMMVGGPQAIYDPKKTYFNITVINRGRRPINITKAALRTFEPGKKKFLLLIDSFAAHRNRVLDESKPTTEFMIEQDDEMLANSWFISIYDATGRSYRKYVHPFLPLSKALSGLGRRVMGQHATK
jgi:hypothetical protein